MGILALPSALVLGLGANGYGIVRSLSRAGFKTEAFPAKAHERAKREAHVIYVAEHYIPREDEPPAPPKR